jgi:7-keto-8-aminopelargonate synthetase-like enzyme
MQISRQAGKVNELFDQCGGYGTLQLAVDDVPVSGRHLFLNGRRLLHFGNCSYMALETDPRMQAAAHAALDRFGGCFSMTRTFAHVPLIEQLEESLSSLFGGHPVVTSTTTTLAHLSALPVLIPPGDVAIFDYMAHASLHMTGSLLKGMGVRIETVRHNSVEALENKIASLGSDVKRIWYIADGVYSMYGDLAPFDELNALLDREPRLQLYLDDAHGGGWCGSHGSGSVFDRIRHKDRLYLAISLSKGLAAMGGGLVVPNAEAAKILRRTGVNQIFNFPVPPASLAAGIECARLLRTEEMEARRQAVQRQIRRFLRTCRELELPLQDWSETPVFYFRVGRPEAAMQMGRTLMERGFYTNTVGYPAVPLTNAGLRVTVTAHHRDEDVDALLEACAESMGVRQEAFV